MYCTILAWTQQNIEIRIIELPLNHFLKFRATEKPVFSILWLPLSFRKVHRRCLWMRTSQDWRTERNQNRLPQRWSTSGTTKGTRSQGKGTTRSGIHLLWHHGNSCEKYSRLGLTKRHRNCNQQVPVWYIVAWFYRLSARMCHQLDKTLCHKWSSVHRQCHWQVPCFRWPHGMQRRHIRLAWWLQWMCRPTHKLGRNTKGRIGCGSKKRAKRLLAIS